MSDHVVRTFAMFLCLFAATAIAVEPTIKEKKPIELPTEYRNHRFYVSPVAQGGNKLRLATDTGGGQSFIYDDTAKRLKLSVEDFKDIVEKLELPIPDDLKKTLSGPYAAMPRFETGVGIPPPLSPWGPVPYLAVRTRSADAGTHFGDGFLGGSWFSGRVWTFDYPAQRLLLHRNGGLMPRDLPQPVALGFKRNPDGSRSGHYPRITVKVADQPFDVLFDTGASTKLTARALRELGDGRPASRATSFIVSTVFDKWRRDFPDWRVMDNAEEGTGQSMIEARRVSIAGHTIDGVWFTRRPDKNFQVMSDFMDQPIVGALGGSGLRHFRVTVDYPGAVAFFER